MSDIFICYSRQDFPIADRLMQQLQAEGWSVFIDKQTHVGRRWHKEIEQELQAARAIVVLWSTTSRDSDYVLEEAEYGKRKDCLFPAFIEFVEPPYGFSRIQTADLTGWKNGDQSGAKGLVNALRLHLNGETTQVDAPIENTVPISPIPEQPIIAQSNETKSERTEINKSWSLMKKILSVSALVFLGFIIFPIFEWDYERFSQLDIQTEELINEIFDNAQLPELILIPAGSFYLGEQDVEFLHSLPKLERKFYGSPGTYIAFEKSFYIGKTEITYTQYDFYVQEQQRNGHKIKSPVTAKGGRGEQPVVNIEWDEALSYTKWLSEQIKKECRLPTESEWEYAARATKNTAYPWGSEIGIGNANCNSCGSQWDSLQAAPVGQFQTNNYGIFDTSGNVWEWTCSEWSGEFNGQEQKCSKRKAKPKVIRGGSWYASPRDIRTAIRASFDSNKSSVDLGFRVLCSFPTE